MAAATNYEDLAREYAHHRRVHPGVLRALIEHGGVDARSRVLEVGCGTGNYLVAIREATGCTSIGIDPSEAMLSHARRRSEHIDWRSGRAEALPVDDASIDLVFSVDVIHHLVDRGAFFAEAARVLRRGGSICTATDSAGDILRRRPLSSHFPETIEHERRRYPAIETLHSELSSAGLVEVRDDHVELEYMLTDIQAYRDRAYSSLHLIDEESFSRGIERLESDLITGPIAALSLYTMVWAGRQHVEHTSEERRA